MVVWRTSNFKKSALNDYHYLQERPKGSKGTLRPDFQANTRPRIFKKPMSPQDTGNPGIVRLRQF
jgi:hypothetical protein